MNRMQEIEARLAAIKAELEKDGADIDALEKEVKELTEERKQLQEKIEKRNRIISDITGGAGTPVPNFFPKEDRKKDFADMTKDEILASPEYRNAYLKMLQGKPLTEAEQRSVATGDVSGAIPTSTYNQIIAKIKQTVPLLDEITLLQVAGNVTFAIEGTNNAAEIHTENGEVTPKEDTLISVTLAGYEIVKIVRISATVRTMAINAFESWLVDQLAENVARVIEYYIVNGSGISMPKGIDYANAWVDGTNAVSWAGSDPTYAELCKLVGLLPGGYARNAKWLMNHKTFWGKIQSIRDDGKAPIVQKDGNMYRILGFPVLFSDYVPDGDMFLGDYRKVVANLSQDIRVDSSAASGFIYNAIDYRGTAIFDCDIALGEAFVKGAKTL